MNRGFLLDMLEQAEEQVSRIPGVSDLFVSIRRDRPLHGGYRFVFRFTVGNKDVHVVSPVFTITDARENDGRILSALAESHRLCERKAAELHSRNLTPI